MRTGVFGLLLLGVLGANAGEGQSRTIAIHVQGLQNADLLLLRLAQDATASMFDSAGIQVIWKTGSPRPADSCCAMALVLHLATSTPANFRPEALAYAFPYQDSTGAITIFYDRIVKRRARSHKILAHVIVHEVTHILQGIARHSETGVMRAFWTTDDYLQMERLPLRFTPDDVELIHIGLRKRIASMQ